MVSGDFIGPLFDPLLQLGPFWALFVVSLVLSVLITLIYKWMTNQEEMKELKQKTKSFQKEMKKYKDDPKKMMAMQKEAMAVNSKYMMKSMKPTLVTFLPVIIIFAWLSANLAYMPIAPGDNFSIETQFKDVDGDTISLIVPEGLTLLSEQNQTVEEGLAKWDIKAGDAGLYVLTLDYRGNQYTQKLRVSDKLGDYEAVEQKIKDSPLKLIKTDLTTIRPFGKFSFFGLKPNWLWTYIIFSMVFSLSLRKAMKLY